MKRSCRLALVAFLCAVSSVVVTPSTTQADVWVRFNVWTWNVSGRIMNHSTATDTKMTEVAVQSILETNSNLVSFNEICWPQYKDIQRRLREAGWPADVNNFSRFQWTTESTCAGTMHGVAIFSKLPLGQAKTTILPIDPLRPKELRVLLCAPIDVPPAQHTFCTTHITPFTPAVTVQELNLVWGTLEAMHAAGQAVIIAGDFNVQPNFVVMNEWYTPDLNVANNRSNRGAYVEVDQNDERCPGYGEGTALTKAGTLDTAGPCQLGSKIDYIFVRADRAHVPLLDGDSLERGIAACDGKPCSDHRILTGRIDLRI